MSGRGIVAIVALVAGAGFVAFAAARCSFFAPSSHAARALQLTTGGGADVAAENRLPGTTDWQITHPSHAGEIQAYTGQVSVQRGDMLDIFVSTKDGAAFDGHAAQGRFADARLQKMTANTIARLSGAPG